MFFFFNDTATTEIYTLSLHDALPIWQALHALAKSAYLNRFLCPGLRRIAGGCVPGGVRVVSISPCCPHRDRKSTRLNSSHANISYAVFCLKKKKYTKQNIYLHNKHIS